MEKAVIDRIVDRKTAVILVGEDQRQHHHPADELPEGAQEGSWSMVWVEDGKIVSMEMDREETDIVRGRVQQKLDRLRKRGRKTPQTPHYQF